MLDLNALRVFERVASLRSFSEAARELGLTRSNVSRSIARLEDALGVRLLQRTTREVTLTAAGEVLRRKCAEILGRVGEAVDLVNGLTGKPRGIVRISSSVGFGANVLARHIPEFLRRYPDVDIVMEGETPDPASKGIDVAFQLGPMPDSGLSRVQLGSMRQYLCASQEYLKRRPAPRTIPAIAEHDAIEMSSRGRWPRSWTFVRGEETARVEPRSRVSVSDALTIHRLVVSGGGLGIISSYVCAPDIEAGLLVRLLPEWSPPPIEVNIVFPTRKEMSPNVHAFVDFMKAVTSPGMFWQHNTYATPDRIASRSLR